MNYQHKTLIENHRWEQLSLAEQMAHIGSEINRSIHWRNKNNIRYANDAVNRALELIGFTIDAVKINSHIKELTRLREMIIDYFYYDNSYSSSDELWIKYFDHFNYKARNNTQHEKL